MSGQKTIKEVHAYVTKIAQKNGWRLTEDQEALEDLVDGLKVNFNRYGYYNCPCRDSQNNRELDRDIICPCRYADPDIKEFGHCYCSLYYQKDYDQSQPLSMIPERRPPQD